MAMDLLELFTTPVLVFDVPGTERLNEALTKMHVAESAARQGLQVSNRGGYHSLPDLARRPEPEHRALCEMLVHHARLATRQIATRRGLPPMRYGVSLQAWAMVMGPGDYAVAHSHAEATWSMSYYPDAGDADLGAQPSSGVLAFTDPRGGLAAVPDLDLSPSTFEVRPATGKLVLFPGYLVHYVHPYQGRRPRVSIAANATIRVEGPFADDA